MLRLCGRWEEFWRQPDRAMDHPLPRTRYHPLMAKLVFGMSQSLDGYVDDAAGTLCMPAPGPAVFRHFLDVVAGHAGAIYGRRIYDTWERTQSLLRSGALDVTPIITHRFDLADWERGFDLLASRHAGKVVLLP